MEVCMKDQIKNQAFPKIAFVGCGNIAHVHMHFLSKIGAKVTAVCDGSSTRARLFSEKYKILKYYNELSEMLRSENPNVLHILTPPHTHFDLIMEGLKGGCHVLVEKPFCLTNAEAAIILQLSKEKGLQVSVDHTRVYNEMITKAREVVNSGKFGKLVRLEYDYDDPGLESQNSQDTNTIISNTMPKWANKIKGGLIADLLPHPLSVFLSFDKAFDIQSVYSKLHKLGIIEELILTLSSAETIAMAKISLNIKPLRNVLSIQCKKGTIKVDLRNYYSVYLPERNLPNILSRTVNTISEVSQATVGFISSVFKILVGRLHPYSGLDEILSRFYSSVTGKNDEKISASDIQRVVGLTEKAIDKAMESGDNESGGLVSPEKISRDRYQGPADYLVTGGTGFIGSEIVKKLIHSGKKVRVLCRSSANSASIPKEAAIAIGDMKDRASLKDALKGIKTVFHCASAMSGDWAEFYESSVLGTSNLLDVLKESSANRLVYLSSLSVINYSNLKNGGTVDEDSPLEQFADKRGFYTRAKKEAEVLVKQFTESNPQICTVILRPGLVYGRNSYKIPQNVGVPLSNLLLVFGLGKRYLGLIYVENLVDAIILSGERNCPSGKVYHIVDPYQPNVRECIDMHNCNSPKKIIPIYIPIFVWKIGFWLVDMLLYVKNGTPGTFSYRFASNSKKLNYKSDSVIKDLKWDPRINFKQSIERVFLN
jgi:2-alkyl-3-oxoalkanoate reductase